MKPEIILIAAMDKNRVIGKGNDIPWRGKLPADMAHFQKLTMGGVVIMGRKTWESIPEKYRPLPGRANIVLTRDQNYVASGAYTAHDPMKVITEGGAKHFWIIGGAELYKQYLPVANCLELTLVDTVTNGDAFFPSYDIAEWDIVSEQKHVPDTNNMFGYTFQRLNRK